MVGIPNLPLAVAVTTWANLGSILTSGRVGAQHLRGYLTTMARGALVLIVLAATTTVYSKGPAAVTQGTQNVLTVLPQRTCRLEFGSTCAIKNIYPNNG